ncbi:PEPxxWA-CTERM sorting domain-containing protein [Sphingomonas panacisoli]|uniref:PEPxxWA-CTERM sorting domain-containing protein n=1 Tax=Sphingomonas panacisoli TaxID=1813879 RepID=UPI001EFFA4D3|nr:PEPxxWA-CTERM sorting domain-containing protein [Sphingomonas panacisoli]
MKKLLFGTAAAVLAFVSVPASAGDFIFNFTATGISGSGTFTTQNTPNSSGGYLITNTTGTVTVGANTFSITGPTNYAAASNLLYAFQTPLLDFDGTSFALSNPAATDVNLYYLGGYRYIRTGMSGNQALTSFTVTPATAAVPEPATWAMMIMGFGLVGGAMRRRSVRVAFA